MLLSLLLFSPVVLIDDELQIEGSLLAHILGEALVDLQILTQRQLLD